MGMDKYRGWLLNGGQVWEEIIWVDIHMIGRDGK